MTPEEFAERYGSYMDVTTLVRPLPPIAVAQLKEAVYANNKLAFDCGQRGVFIGIPVDMHLELPSVFGSNLTVTFKFQGLSQMRSFMNSLCRMKWEGYLFELIYREDLKPGPVESHFGIPYGGGYDDIQRLCYVELHATYFPEPTSSCQVREKPSNLFTVEA